MVSHFIKFGNLQGSSALLRAHGSGGASAIINMIAPQKNFRAKPKQAGKKEGGLGEGIFARLLRLGWEAFPQFLRQQEGKTEKFSFPQLKIIFARW